MPELHAPPSRYRPTLGDRHGADATIAVRALLQALPAGVLGLVAAIVGDAPPWLTFLGPLADRGRAIVELRRLAERHPGTPEATHAASAVARLRAELFANA